MIDSKVLSLLTASSSVKVYPDSIPEEADRPAMSFAHTASPFQRVLNGNKTCEFVVWQISISASDKTELQGVIDELMSIDNTKNDDFRKIFTELVMKHPKDVDSPYRMATVDLTVYE